MLTVGQVWDFERVIQVEQSNVYRLSAHAERHCVADEVSYLERLVNARKLLPIGFVPLGDLALRADIAERLSALIRVEARSGKFRINDAMLSIAGATKIQMEKILYDLNYIKVGEDT